MITACIRVPTLLNIKLTNNMPIILKVEYGISTNVETRL